MTIELLHTFSTISYITAGVLLLVAVALFFLLDVKKMLGDVTGANARRAIEKMRQQNGTHGYTHNFLSPMNEAKNKSRDGAASSIRTGQRSKSGPLVRSPQTTKLAQQSVQTANLAQDAVQPTQVVVMNVDAGTPEFGVDYQLEFTSSCVLVE